MFRRLRGPNNEGILAVILLGLVVVTSIANPAFCTRPHDVRRAAQRIVPLIFALGVLIVIISGGIDVSFAAISVFAAYSTVRAAQEFVDPGIVGAVLIALGLGALLGLVNGVVIARFRLPTLIVTLGTQGIFTGLLLTYVGSRYVADLPGSLASLSKTNLLEVIQRRSRRLPPRDDRPGRPPVPVRLVAAAQDDVRPGHLRHRR